MADLVSNDDTSHCGDGAKSIYFVAYMYVV